MVALGLCGGCEDGDHDSHVYWLKKPLPGVLGGFACGCRGDCADRPRPRYWFEDAIDALKAQGGFPAPTTPDHPVSPAHGDLGRHSEGQER